jgi:hypothetical protein
MPEILSACWDMCEFKPELITDLLTKLTPENIRVAVVGKKFEGKTDKVEKWCVLVLFDNKKFFYLSIIFLLFNNRLLTIYIKNTMSIYT